MPAPLPATIRCRCRSPSLLTKEERAAKRAKPVLVHESESESDSESDSDTEFDAHWFLPPAGGASEEPPSADDCSVSETTPSDSTGDTRSVGSKSGCSGEDAGKEAPRADPFNVKFVKTEHGEVFGDEDCVWAEIPGISPEHALASSKYGVRVRAKGGSRRLGAPTRGCLRKETGRHRVGVNGKVVPVYQLVCMAFMGPRPSDKHTVDHIDGNCSNDAAYNLRWATPKEQRENQRKCEAQRNGKPVEARPKDDEKADWVWFASATAAANELKVHRGSISHVCNPKKTEHESTGGYVFRFAAPLETQENLHAIVDSVDPRDNREAERWVERDSEAEEWAEHNPEAERRPEYNPTLRVSNRGRAQVKQPTGDNWSHKYTPRRTRGEAYAVIKFKRKRNQFHRVVWEAFNGEVPPGLVVDHKREGNKADNALENLQTITPAENTAKAREHKRMLEAAAK